MSNTSENAGLVANLENKLPVKISKEIEVNSPQFLQLLSKVAEKLDKSGRTQVTFKRHRIINTDYYFVENPKKA